MIVTGSTGLVGRALTATLQRSGYVVTRLVRRLPGPWEVGWDPVEGTIDAAALEGHDAVVHLAGEGIGDHRWTERHKAKVVDSRVQGTSLLARTLASLDRPPAVLASGSAVGIYGDRGDEELTEESALGEGFLADVCRQWEGATAAAEEGGIRVVHLRSGVVQSATGGALKKQLLPFKLGMGGRLGTGRQWVSWISLDDEVGAIVHVLGDDSLRGPVNVTAPQPVTNAEFTKALGEALRRPTILPTPTFVLDALFSREMVREMLFVSQRVLPARLQAAGYHFRHPELRQCLAELVGRKAV